MGQPSRKSRTHICISLGFRVAGWTVGRKGGSTRANADAHTVQGNPVREWGIGSESFRVGHYVPVPIKKQKSKSKLVQTSIQNHKPCLLLPAVLHERNSNFFAVKYNPRSKSFSTSLSSPCFKVWAISVSESALPHFLSKHLVLHLLVPSAPSYASVLMSCQRLRDRLVLSSLASFVASKNSQLTEKRLVSFGHCLLTRVLY